MLLQERSISYKNLALNIACVNLQWEFYIEETDFPDYPDIRKKSISIYVSQAQFLKDPYKGQVKTTFRLGSNGTPWDKDTPNKLKQHITKVVEDFILSYEDDLTGKAKDAIIASYKSILG